MRRGTKFPGCTLDGNVLSCEAAMSVELLLLLIILVLLLGGGWGYSTWR